MSSLSVALGTPRGRFAVIVLRSLVAAVFVFAAVPKLVDPAAFAQSIANYRLVPDAWSGVIAAVLPVAELAAAMALASGYYARGAALVAGAMLTVFAAAMIQA